MFVKKLALMTVLVTIIGILSGCATRTLNIYVGKTVADAMDKLGVPVTTYNMPDGTKAYVWQKSEVNSFADVTISTGAANVGNSTGVDRPVVTRAESCVYTMYATRVGNLNSPSSWRIVGYEKPAPECD